MRSNRRRFLMTSGALALAQSHLLQAAGLVQSVSDGVMRKMSAIVPEERPELREYDRSHPEIMVWHTAGEKSDVAPYEEHTRTVGFVEGASDSEKLLYVPGLLARFEVPQTKRPGFYLYFGVTLAWLSLPRREGGKVAEMKDRYAFPTLYTVRPRNSMKKGLVSIDYRKMQLIEDGKVYSPSQIVDRPSKDGALLDVESNLRTMSSAFEYPNRDLNSNSVSTDEVLFFDLPHKPIRFKLIPPPLVINGMEIPMPTCYFEPYNSLKRDWVD